MDCATPARDKLSHRLCSVRMRIEFLKMQGLGNDFFVFDAPAADSQLDGSKLRALAPQLGRDFLMESSGGVVHARVRDDGLVSVDMGAPNFDPRALPMEADAEAPTYSLKIDGSEVEIGAVSMGNPHAVLQVSDVKIAPLARFGPSIENHPRFPKRANVGFMQIVDRSHL